MSLGLNPPRPPSRRRSVRGLLAAAALFTGGTMSAQQVCVGSKFEKPVVRLAVSIEACDYLAAIAERTHPRECTARLQSVQRDAGSRVHALERLLADSLVPVFAKDFGYLQWQASAPADRWTVQVRLQ